MSNSVPSSSGLYKLYVIWACLCVYLENGLNRVGSNATKGNHSLSRGGAGGWMTPGLSQNSRSGSYDNLLTQSDSPDQDIYVVVHDYITDQPGQLSIKRGEQLKISRMSEDGDWCEGINIHEQIGWVPASYIAKVNSLEKHSWFHGNITRAEAELSLSSGINGSFLIRESESKPGQYSISLRYDGRVFHYRIHTDPQTSQYYVTPESKFETLPELVVYHSKHPDGLTAVLQYPAPNPRKPPIYGLSHDVDEWEVDRAEIAMGAKLGAGQYGEVYKAEIKRRNMVVAVKTFKVSSLFIGIEKLYFYCRLKHFRSASMYHFLYKYSRTSEIRTHQATELTG